MIAARIGWGIVAGILLLIGAVTGDTVALGGCLVIILVLFASRP